MEVVRISGTVRIAIDGAWKTVTSGKNVFQGVKAGKNRSRMTGFSDSLPGNIFMPTGNICASKRRPIPTIGSPRFSLEGPLF